MRKRYRLSICLLSFRAVPHLIWCVCRLCVSVLCVSLCVSVSFLFPLHPLLSKPQSVARTTPRGPCCIAVALQCQRSGNLLALGRQHKIRIIAVDYGTQWAAACERFIHPGKRDCGGGKKKESLGPSAALPRWAQA